MKHIIKTLILIIFTLPVIVSAGQDIYSLDINGRSIGLGKSTLASDDYYSNNAAALGQAAQSSLSISQSRLSFDKYGYEIDSIINFGNQSLAIGFDQLIINNQSYEKLRFNPNGTPIIDPITNKQAVEIDYERRFDSMFKLTYGIKVIEQVSIGLEAQAIHLKVGNDYAWGFDGNVGVLVNITDAISLATTISQLNRKWHAWHYPYRENLEWMNGSVGFGWQIIPEQLTIYGNIDSELKDKFNQNDVKGHVGVEYEGFKPLTLRLGWDADHLNVGASMEWNNIQFDYAAITSGALYDANRLTIKLSF